MRKPPLMLVGYGRFGRLAASILRRRFHVHVLEIRRNVRLGRGLHRATEADIPRHRVIILALPVHRLEDFLRRNGARFAPDSFVADVSAVKEEPLRWMKSHLPGSVSFSGLHPLFGPDSARKIPEGHPIVVCRGRSTDACQRRLEAMLKSFGLRPVRADAATHDRTIASTLFMTQWIGRVAIAGGLTRRYPFENPAFKHLRTLMTRAANDPPDLLRDIYRFNRHTRDIVKKLRIRSKTVLTP